MSDQRIVELLSEIRDDQKELLGEYRKLAERSVAMQQEALDLQKKATENQFEAVTDQKRAIAMSRTAMRIVPIIVLILLGLLAYILFRHGGMIF